MYYPLGMLHDEAAMIIERDNARIVTEAQLIQYAIGSILSKDSRKHFDKMIRQINVIAVPFDDEKELPRLLPEGYREEE